MDYENKLIKLLNLDAKRNGNVIELYELERMVGTIKKIEENNEIFYQTSINFKGFNFSKKRNIKETGYNYKFQIQDWDNRIFIEMDLGETPYLTLYSEATGAMSFSINDRELDLNFRTQVYNGSLLEHLIVRLNTKSDLEKYLGDYYLYGADITNNNGQLKRMELTSRLIDSHGKVLVIANYAGHERKNITEGSVRDTIRLDEHGREAFSRFRAYINNLFPFEMDFLETFLEERGIRDDAFIELYQDLSNFKNYYAIREVNDTTLLGVNLDKEAEPLKSYGTVICDLKDCYDFGHLRGTGDYSGYYSWNNEYIFRLSNKDEVESVFDIKNRQEIKDIDVARRLYKESKSKVLVKK